MSKHVDLSPEAKAWAADDAMRKRFPEILVPASSHTQGCLHIPDPADDVPEPDPASGHETDAVPVCARWWNNDNGWKAKWASCYPPGFREWCPACIHVWWEAVEHDQPYDNEAVLRKLYWGEGLAMYDIADRFDVGEATIRKYMVRHGVERRDSSTGRLPKDKRRDPERATP